MYTGELNRLDLLTNTFQRIRHDPQGKTKLTGNQLISINEDHDQNDNAELRQFLRDTLHTKYQVYKAEEGNAAFEMARQINPDLIVSDVAYRVGFQGPSHPISVRHSRKSSENRRVSFWKVCGGSD